METEKHLKRVTLEDLQRIAHEIGEPQPKSGKQELFEAIVNMYI
jgi:xylose isomerase